MRNQIVQTVLAGAATLAFVGFGAIALADKPAAATGGGGDQAAEGGKLFA
jgi:hypothetical protein